MKNNFNPPIAPFNLKPLASLAVVVIAILPTFAASGVVQSKEHYTSCGAASMQQSSAASRPFWRPTSGPQGGDVLAMASNINGYVFAGTLGGGVFRSTDNGITWTAAGKTAGAAPTIASNGRATAASAATTWSTPRPARSFANRDTQCAF